MISRFNLGRIYHLRLGKFPEAGCQAVILDVTVSLNSNVQDMDRLIQDALEDHR